MIYFDNNATTQLAPEVLSAMQRLLEVSFGNPSASYSLGREAKDAITNARANVGELLGVNCPSEITFTSGGTESDNWAILAALDSNPGKRHIITTRVEHDAIRKLCEKLEIRGYRVTWLDVSEDGALDLDGLRSALGVDTAVVSTMFANNETGILFPVGDIGKIVKEHSDAIFHVDGVNAAGKIPINLKETTIDLFSISAHKFHGPKGIGALYIRDGIDIQPLFIGGGQENGKRPGTESVHQIVGLGAAAKLVSDISSMDKVRKMRDRLEAEILEKISNSRLNGSRDPKTRLPNTSNISFENTNGEMILARLDAAGIYVSTGSACNSHDHRASVILEAMNVPYSMAMGAIRFSLGRFNTESEIDQVIGVLPGIVGELRALAK